MNETDNLVKWNEKTFTKFSQLSDIRISKSGKKIAYVQTKANLENDDYKQTIVVENLATGERNYIQDASKPRFSPDGKQLTFIKKEEKGEKKGINKLMLMDLRSMTAKKIMEHKYIFDIRWNQDNRRVLITSCDRLGDEKLFFEDEVPVWFNTRGFLDNENAVLEVFDTEGEEVIDKIEVDTFVLPYVSMAPLAIWHDDSVVYNVPQREDPYKLFNVYLYDDGEKEKIFEEVSYRGIDSNGETVLLHGKPEKESHAEHDYLYLWDGEEEVSLTEEDGINNNLAKISKDGTVYFTSSKKGRVTLETLQNGEKTTLVDERAQVPLFDVSEDGKVAYLKLTETQLNEVYLWDNEQEQLTSYNTPILDKLDPKPYHHFRFENLDRELDGWYIKPELDEDENAPVIVFVHGGPKGMYGYYFRYIKQLLAANGFYIVFINPRGSNGYDEDFALAVLERTGKEDFQDIMAGIDKFLELEDQASEDKVGVTGISYGGFMTNWALTHSDLFKAGVSENGISHWLTSYAYSDIGLWFDKDVIGEHPLENENFRELSPLFHAEQVHAPVLLIHSLNDYRCPLDQSVMFYHRLKDLGKEAYISIFKKGPHGHSRTGTPKHRMKRYKLIAEFFDRKLVEEKEGFDAAEVLGKKER